MDETPVADSTGSAPSAPPVRASVDRLVTFFETLARDDLPRLGSLYSRDARFKDPFNDVRGIAAIAGIFEHMFATLEEPRFIVTSRVVENAQCFLVWDFTFRFRRFNRHAVQTIHGGSHITFNRDGLVACHRDYWDAAEELYERLPLIGSLMRWIKRQAQA